MSKRTRRSEARRQSQRNLRRFLRDCRRRGRPSYRRARLAVPPDPTIQHLMRSLKQIAGRARIQEPPVLLNYYVTLRLPKRFSLSHPKCATESFGFLASLIRALHIVRAPMLLLDYHDCEELDLDASVCMDAILRLFIRRYAVFRSVYKKRAVACGIRVINMNRESVRKFYWSIGTGESIHGLGLQFPDTLRCPLETGSQGPKSEEQIAVTSTKLFEHLEACLARFNKKLTPKDAERFGNIIGEVLANAGQHSSLAPNYAIAHFVEHNTDDPNDHGGRFQIVIFNFGQTIYERLKDPKTCLTHEKLWPEMENLSKDHTRWRISNPLKFPYEKETLWTLYSLQDGVSSLRHSSNAESGRGSGTTKFITDFLELRSRAPDKNSVLTLMSGQTRIQLNGDYGIKVKINSHGHKQKVIAFNPSNDLSEPPDPKVVTFVPPYFPGTLLYADIYLTEEHLQSA